MKEILKDEMIDKDLFGKPSIDELKEGDIVRLKGSLFGLVTSSGEYTDDIDYGEMYKAIKRFKYITHEQYHDLWLEKKRNNAESEALKQLKEKYLYDLLLYLNKNKQLLPEERYGEYDNIIREKSTEVLGKIELSNHNYGTFYEVSDRIVQYSVAGYNRLFFIVNVSKTILLKILEGTKKINEAESSKDVFDFSEYFLLESVTLE